MTIEEKLKKLPALPGVYIMKSCDGEVIYVGKSRTLKNRVKQYFKKSGHSGKVGAMVKNIADFEYIITDTEIEALVLECNLIKKYKPYYNILLKDNKQYPFIKITIKDDYPKMSLSRKNLKDGARYFGPFTAGVARETMNVIYDIFKIPACKKEFPRDLGKGRACLNYHINKCIAPCTGAVSKAEYRAVIDEICDFLDGKTASVIKKLHSQMMLFSENLEYEKAADLRDKIKRLKELQEKQNITVSGSGDKDIIAIKADGDIANVQIFNIRGGKMLGRSQMWIESALDESKEVILEKFIMQYYMDSEFVPQSVLTNILPENFDLLEKYLCEKRGNSVDLRVPERGVSRDIVNMALLNATQALKVHGEERIKNSREKYATVNNFALELGLEKIGRIEAYDISNTAGKDSVGGMIVVENGVFNKSEYRLFKIKSVESIDDYASTKEVVRRRFERAKEDIKFARLPDVILADGGIGHVNSITQVLLELELNIPVYGMVKDSRHKTDRLISTDGEIISLSEESFRFVTSIQNEVHRFAIGYHKRLREGAIKRSELDNIEGIGPIKKKSLLRTFGSVKAVSEASIPEIASADGIKTTDAEKIYKYFHD